MNRDQGSYAWRYLSDLTDLLPHRASATDVEKRAAEWIAEKMKAVGYEVTRQDFHAPRDTLYAGPPMVFVGVLVAASVGLVYPWVGILLAVLMTVPMVGDMLGVLPDFDLLLALHASRNVVASQVPAGKQPRLIITAHYDTQKGSLLFHPRFAAFITPLFTAAYVALILVPVSLLFRWIWPNAAWPAWILIAAGAVLLAVAGFLTIARWTGRYINGANDNGSGTAVAMALARRLAESDVPWRDQVTFVFTGSEEVGERGAKHYFRNAGKFLDRRAVRVVNLDNIGGGNLHYLLGEGMLVYKPYDPELLALAAQRAEQEEPGFLTPQKNLLLPTDGLLATTNGFRAITFIAMGDDGNIPNYHWHTDVLENADRQLVEREEDMLWRFLGDLAQSSAASAGAGA